MYQTGGIMPVPYIMVVNGPGSGRRLTLTGEISIGRGLDNDLCISDQSVSRRHAIIRNTEGQSVIYDLGAANGVFVNGQPVEEYRLRPGDEIRLGKTVIRFDESSPEVGVGRSASEVIVESDSSPTIITASSVQDISSAFLNVSDMIQSPEELVRARNRLAAVYKSNQVISRERNLERLLAQIGDQVLSLIPAHNCAILLKDERTGTLYTEYARSVLDDSDIVISSTIVKQAVENAEAIITRDAAGDARFGAAESVILQNINSAMCAPLWYLDEVLGAIYVDARGLVDAFKREDLELLVALSAPAAISIKNVSYMNQLDRLYRDTLVVLTNAVELRDHYTAGHIWRVTNFAVEMARELGWDEDRIKLVEMGGVLHDIGKISVDNAILSKSGMLTSEEFEKVKLHPERGAWLMKDSLFLKPLIPFCLYHHEHFDGTGYPFGLDGMNIPTEGRLIAVADAFDALTSHRPYHEALPTDEAIKRIVAARGTHFDPECVDALVRCYQAGRLDYIFQNYMKNKESIVCPFCSTFVRIPDQGDFPRAFECPVCHRKILLRRDGETYSAELIT